MSERVTSIMKCEIHGIEMEYAGGDPFGGDIWFCQMCVDEEDYHVWHNDAYQQDHPEEYPELWEEDELDDDGVYIDDEVIHAPYDDDDEA